MKAVAITVFVIYVLRECQPEKLLEHKCIDNAQTMYRVCCVFPPFFTQEDAKECGAAVNVDFFVDANNETDFRRDSNCSHWRCVLKKYSLLTPRANLDLDKYYVHLDQWVSLNPIFAKAMVEAKVFCKQDFQLSLPLHTCTVFNFQSCIRYYISVECPIYLHTQECVNKNELFRECQQYFHKKQ